MERIKQMKEQLISVVQSQLSDIKSADTKELGDAIDMIKDLADIMKLCEEEKYYKTVTEAMEHERHYYTPYPYYLPPEEYPDVDWHYWPERDMDLPHKMYYGGDRSGRSRDSRGRFTGNSGSSGSQSGGRNYQGGDTPWEKEFPMEMRDHREGRSPLSRKMYMESKEMHKDKATKIKDLENYLKELSEDIVEMIQDASPEERAVMTNKVTFLANKISSMPVNG